MELSNDLIYFDLETTGTNINTDKIIEIYAVKHKVDGGIEEYYQLVNPQRFIELEATAVHGFTYDMLKDKPTFADIAPTVFEFFKDCDLGGYNIMKFDIPFLTEELMKCKIPFNPLKQNIVDGFRILTKLESLKLGDVYKRYFGEEIDGAHGAEADVNATIRVIEKQSEIYKFNSPSEISKIIRTTNDGYQNLDLLGLFYRKEDGDIYYGIGKHHQKLVKNHMDYLNWIIDKSDFDLLSKRVARRVKKIIIEKE